MAMKTPQPHPAMCRPCFNRYREVNDPPARAMLDKKPRKSLCEQCWKKADYYVAFFVSGKWSA